MSACGSHGPDYIILAPNVFLDAWFPRQAEYRDICRALHLLLMIHGGKNPERVTEFTPHGCRHFQVTAGAQLASLGLLKKSALETLGHWEKGSKMPGKYDSASCVTELQTRSVIAETLRTGWRPSADGSLPAPATPALERTMMPRTPTAHAQTAKADLVVSCSSSSLSPA